MKRSRTRQRIYTVPALIALLYTIVGSFLNFTTIIDCFGPPSDYQYDIRNDPIAMGLFFLISGIALFLLFFVLERRENREIPRNRIESKRRKRCAIWETVWNNLRSSTYLISN